MLQEGRGEGHVTEGEEGRHVTGGERGRNGQRLVE